MYKKNSIALKSNGIVFYATYANLAFWHNFGSVLMAIACTSLKNKEQVKMPEDNKMPDKYVDKCKRNSATKKSHKGRSILAIINQ